MQPADKNPSTTVSSELFKTSFSNIKGKSRSPGLLVEPPYANKTIKQSSRVKLQAYRGKEGQREIKL